MLRHLGSISLGQGMLAPSTSTEEDALSPFPSLNAHEEKDSFDEDDAPFPRDAGMFEDDLVDDGDIQDREGRDEAGHDGPEEERVTPDIVHPLREVALGFGLHAEEGAAHVDHFPGEEEGEPG